VTNATALLSELSAAQASAQTFHSFVSLMYHNIAADDASHADLSPSATSYFVSHAAFHEQLARIADGGATCIDDESLRRFYDPGRAVDEADCRPHVLLTFDDGWRGGVELGGPLLERYGAPAMLFVTTGFLGRPHFLTRRELSRIDHRLFRVGSHGCTHRMLSLMGEPDIRAELSDSKRLLEDVMGCAVDTLSIPSGAVDARVRRIAAECGYTFLFDSQVRVNRRGDNPMAIGRVAVMRNTRPQDVDRYVRQRIGRERLRRAILQAPKRLMGLPRYERVRRRLLGEKPSQRVTHSF
jgi:peptidoglycan/xylan/chitin deacetylase (PgdA/CDA1 family)